MSLLRQKLLTDFYRLPNKQNEISTQQQSDEQNSTSETCNELESVAQPDSSTADGRRYLSSADNCQTSSQVADTVVKVVRTYILLGKENRRKRRAPSDDPKQMILDVGQKKFGHQQCRQCRMVYDCNSISDRKQHEKFHGRFLSTEWFRVQTSQLEVWRKSTFCTAQNFKGNYGYIYCIRQTSKCTLKNRIDKVIMECVNKELGFTPDLAQIWTSDGRRQAWVYITALDSYYFIGAIVLVESVQRAQLCPSKRVMTAIDSDIFMGVNRIWVHQSLRQKGIASFLLDQTRTYFISSGVVPRENIVFNSLTDSGLEFAKRYIPDGKVLFYNHCLL